MMKRAAIFLLLFFSVAVLSSAGVVVCQQTTVVVNNNDNNKYGDGNNNKVFFLKEHLVSGGSKLEEQEIAEGEGACKEKEKESSPCQEKQKSLKPAETPKPQQEAQPPQISLQAGGGDTTSQLKQSNSHPSGGSSVPEKDIPDVNVNPKQDAHTSSGIKTEDLKAVVSQESTKHSGSEVEQQGDNQKDNSISQTEQLDGFNDGGNNDGKTDAGTGEQSQTEQNDGNTHEQATSTTESTTSTTILSGTSNDATVVDPDVVLRVPLVFIFLLLSYTVF